MVEIIVETEVRPTEDIEKVKKALQTIVTLEDLKVAEITTGFKTISVKCESIKCMEPLRNAIRIQQIEPAVRAYLYKRIENSTLVILIHKQAAFAGKVSLIDSDRESPLGPIRITITGTSNEIEEVIKFLTEE
ncbi:MAG: RNA-binding domain-containing protein [Desulfurococcaceae archaeon]